MDQHRASLELKTVDVHKRIISGYAAIHHNLDRVDDIIDPSASVKAIGRLQAPSDVGVFIGHDSSRLPIGIPQKIQATPRGLYTETYILKGHDGDNLLAVAKDLHDHGQALGMSIGYKTKDSRHEVAARRRARRILDYTLREYSYAAHQVIANPEALTTDVKARRRKALGEGSDSAGGALVPPDQKGGGMYRVAQEDGKWCVYCDTDNDADGDDDRMIGSYASEELANAVVAALRKEAGGSDDGKTLEGQAVWTAKYMNDLPDSAFMYVEPGGQKDGDGKTVPRSKRHFPVRDAGGTVDLAHVRDAVGRIPQAKGEGLDDAKKAELQARARRMLEKADDGKTYEEPAEWKAGASITIRGFGYALLDLSEQLAEEHKAMTLLGEDTRNYLRIRPAVRGELKTLAGQLGTLLDWAETIERGDDGKARVAWIKQQFALTEI